MIPFSCFHVSQRMIKDSVPSYVNYKNSKFITWLLNRTVLKPKTNDINNVKTCSVNSEYFRATYSSVKINNLLLVATDAVK